MRVLLAALPLLVLVAGCRKEKEPAPEASGAVEARPGLTVTDGELLLPPVSGRPGAAYFTLTNGGDKPVTLAAIDIAGAERAEIHETRGGTMEMLMTLPVAPGETVQFARGGKHVMVFGLSPSLAAGGGAEMTLTFADGDKLSVPLKIAAIGGGAQPASQPRTSIGGGGTMSGMDMGHGDPGDAR